MMIVSASNHLREERSEHADNFGNFVLLGDASQGDFNAHTIQSLVHEMLLPLRTLTWTGREELSQAPA